MINLYHQVGFCGIIIFLLGLLAFYASVRGIVLVLLIKKQSQQSDSILNKIAEKITLTKDKNNASIINSVIQVELKGVFSSVYFLKLCAAVGPLLGLLGTVIGMVHMFSALSVQAQNSIPNASMLAGGIWMALLTTVMGLCLAIPSLIVHYYLLINIRLIRTQVILKVSDHE